MIRVALVDDDALIREGLRMIIDQASDLEVIATAGNGEEAVRVARRATPRRDAHGRADACSRWDRSNQADHRFGGRSQSDHPDDVRTRRVRLRGSAGRSQRIPPEENRARATGGAIRVVAGGEALLSPSVTRRLIEEFTRRPPVGRE